MRRREFLEASGLVALSGMLARSTRAEDLLLVYGDRPQNLGAPIQTFDRLITPVRSFFVRSHFGPPALDPSRHVRISGQVRRPSSLSADDLRRFPEVTVTAVVQCAGNGRGLQRPTVPGIQWQHGAMGQAAFTGVRLRDVLEAAGLFPGAKFVQLRGADQPPKPTVPAYVRGLPLDKALDPSTIVAFAMNGEPLTLAHGAPLRLIVPGWAANHWIKWLVEVHPQEDEPEGFYYRKAYRLPRNPVVPGTAVPPEQTVPVTTFPVKSVIARPMEGERIAAGAGEVVGVAFSGVAPIARVEVSVDGGRTWAEAALAGEPGAGRWQVFRRRFAARRGTYRALARATDTSGAMQPELALWNPSGYFWNAWHTVDFTAG